MQLFDYRADGFTHRHTHYSPRVFRKSFPFRNKQPTTFATVRDYAARLTLDCIPPRYQRDDFVGQAGKGTHRVRPIANRPAASFR